MGRLPPLLKSPPPMITTWSKGPADLSISEEILVENLRRVRRHPWWLARAKLAVALLQRCQIQPPASVIDIGCGWGVNLQALEWAGYRVTGLDISRRILERIDQPNRRLLEADLNAELPAGHETFDAFLALDVIEHIDDDSAALRKMARLLRPQGLAVISVPARPDLFSEFDRVQSHRRRYLPDTLRSAFDGSDLEVQKIFWWGAWMVPVLRWMRRGQNGRRDPGSGAKTYADYLRLPPWPAPLLMKCLYAFEQSRALKGRLKSGTSLIALARSAIV